MAYFMENPINVGTLVIIDQPGLGMVNIPIKMVMTMVYGKHGMVLPTWNLHVFLIELAMGQKLAMSAITLEGHLGGAPHQL